MEQSCDMHTQRTNGNIEQNIQDTNLDGFGMGVTYFLIFSKIWHFSQKWMFLPIENGDIYKK
jgi:hypothetical protein